MNIVPTSIPGAVIIEPRVFGDARGFFMETWQQQRYAEAGLPLTWLQDNLSKSRRGVLRGLHLQNPQPQGKLITVLMGEVFDVTVDVRLGSPTFGKWTSVLLSGENKKQFYIPPGCAHGFAVLSEEAIFFYKCTEFYDAASEITILWDDADLGIDWPLATPVISAKDLGGMRLKDIPKNKLVRYAEPSDLIDRRQCQNTCQPYS